MQRSSLVLDLPRIPLDRPRPSTEGRARRALGGSFGRALLAAVLLAACEGSVSSPTDARATPDGGGASPDGAPGGSDASVSAADGATPERPDAGRPTTVVGDCGELGAVGEWQSITPPDALIPRGSEGSPSFLFAVDPIHAGTVYLGTAYRGMYKSTDCGSTWVSITAGRNGEAWNHSMNWTFLVDPITPDVVYTNSGYGDHGNGLWKSTNGGLDWDAVWPPPSQPELATHLTYQFANVVVMDPDDHEHLLLTFHEECRIDGVTTCIAESEDAGATWRLIPGQPSWNGNEGQILYFLDGRTHWLWGSQTNGFFRTTDGGATWTEAHQDGGRPFFTSHLQGSGMARSASGTFYLSAGDGVFRGTDGLSWSLIPGTGPIAGGIVADGETIYVSRCYYGGFCSPSTDFLLTTPEGDGTTWAPLPSPVMTMGGSLGFDPSHELLYSSNADNGFWRVRVR